MGVKDPLQRFLDDDGLMVDDGTVFKLADDHLWVMTNGMERSEYFAEAHPLNVGVTGGVLTWSV